MARAMKWVGVVIRTTQGGSVDYVLFPALGEARGWARKEKMGEAVPFPSPGGFSLTRGKSGGWATRREGR